MKKYVREILPAVILAVIASFMLYIYEPVIMFSSNTSDFWFDIDVLFLCTTYAFAILFFVLFFLYNMIYLITIKLNKKMTIYHVSLLVGFIFFFVAYIHGNFLAGKLPVLDGRAIEWNKYTGMSFLSVIIIVALVIITFIAVKKTTIRKSIKAYSIITCAVFVMLLTSLVSTLITKSDWKVRKEYAITPTSSNINNYSTDKNFVIFLLDAIDSETAENVYNENTEFKNTLKDFTYYPDTVGAYAFTRDSVPLMLSGIWSENKTDFDTYYNDAMDDSKLLKLLDDNKYNTNIYDEEIVYNREGAKQIKNLSFDSQVDKIKLIKQETKYALFKYLPFFLKKYSRIENMDIKSTRMENECVENQFVWDDKFFCDEYLKQNTEKGTDKEFKFIHLEGAHSPFNYDKNLNSIDEGEYEDKIAASFTVIDKYIEYLKENDVYDNTAIIILADHGFWFDVDVDSLLKRQNPIFYVKGFDEHHDERQISEEKMSFDYLQDIYKNLVEGKKSTEILDGVDNSGPRRFLLYVIAGYDHMEEYMQNGRSKDFNTLEKTGNIYER